MISKYIIGEKSSLEAALQLAERWMLQNKDYKTSVYYLTVNKTGLAANRRTSITGAWEFKYVIEFDKKCVFAHYELKSTRNY